MRAGSITTSVPRCLIAGLTALAMLLPACSTAPKAPESDRGSRPVITGANLVADAGMTL